MTTYLVTRHQGAIEWINYMGHAYDSHISHLHDINSLNKGDTLIGSLPINIVADLCERGVNYVHLSLRIPEELRGKELTVEQLANIDAKLERFEVKKL
ncbi:MAG: CRISPR-associated protein Csx16 [Moraxellaceae bacterium]|nr:CRISPR-associated protein Csx16 [Moraxellaceae bacterium]